jgi:hypothetical protein
MSACGETLFRVPTSAQSTETPTPYVHPQRSGSWYNSPWVQACFPREAIEVIEPTDQTLAYGYNIDEPEWIARPLDDIDVSAGFRAARDDCFSLAGTPHIDGDEKIFLRVDRRRDGSATARVHATMNGDGLGASLLCCLREAALPLAHELTPGHALRWEIDLGSRPPAATY